MSECGPTEEDATMPCDPEEELAENIRRFPEQYPASIGGLQPDPERKAAHKEYADRATIIDPLDSANKEPFDGDEDPEDLLGVHALDDGLDIFEESEDNFVPFDSEF